MPKRHPNLGLIEETQVGIDTNRFTLEYTQFYEGIRQDYYRPICEKPVKDSPNYPEKDNALSLFDCWKVHKSVEFREWLKKEYPKYHFLFIPANCTTVIQPADVLILQRPFKHNVSNKFTNWSTEQIVSQLNDDEEARIRLPTNLGTLKPLIVKWTIESWLELKEQKQMIREGWFELGFNKIFDPEFQLEALKAAASNSLPTTIRLTKTPHCQLQTELKKQKRRRIRQKRKRKRMKKRRSIQLHCWHPV